MASPSQPTHDFLKAFKPWTKVHSEGIVLYPERQKIAIHTQSRYAYDSLSVAYSLFIYI